MNAIVVVDKNWSIGRDGGLLVHLPGDLKYFKEKTMGKTIIMGRKTLESFPGGNPLPGRDNVVLTRNKELKVQGCRVFFSKEQLLDSLGDTEDLYVSGGQSIYEQFFDDCDTFYVTKIYEEYPADKHFPDLDKMKDVEKIWESELQEEKGIKYRFLKYKRKT